MASPPALSRLALRTRWRLLDLQQTASALDAGPPVSAMGLTFPGPVGLAAGFDRHGRLLPHAGRLGLGSIETGSAFAGFRHVVAPPLEKSALCGVSLGIRPGLPWAHAGEYFVRAMREHGNCADYFCLNPGRDSAPPDDVADVIRILLASDAKQRPIMVKLARHWQEPVAVARTWVAAGAAGLLVSTEGMAAPETILRSLRDAFHAKITLVNVGGIETPEIALARKAAGADLVQLHRGMVRYGCALVAAINRAWRESSIPRHLPSRSGPAR